MQHRFVKILAGSVAVAALAFGASAIASASQDAPGPKAPATAAQPAQGGPDMDAIEQENGAGDAAEAADEEKSEAAEAPDSEQADDDDPGGHADEPGNPDAEHEAQGDE
jgi:hypothetical protein